MPRHDLTMLASPPTILPLLYFDKSRQPYTAVLSYVMSQCNGAQISQDKLYDLKYQRVGLTGKHISATWIPELLYSDL